jgi:uncharacterized protein YndB with AHSA1/START domain
MSDESMAQDPASGPEFTISREFSASREQLWRAWTDTEELTQWWGPKGFTVTNATLDLRPGGVFHYCLRGPDGREMWGRFIFREIVEPERLVYLSSFSDSQAHQTRAPFSELFPLELLSTLKLEDCHGGVRLTITAREHDATDAEAEFFHGMFDSMQQGWSGTFKQLEAYLYDSASAKEK